MPIDPSAVPVSPGWSPTTTVNALGVVLQALFGGGVLYGIARAVALLWRLANERSKQDNDAAAAVRKEMFDIVDRLQKRIDTLETQASEERRRNADDREEERKRHGEEMAAMRSSYEERISKLQQQVSGLTHQLITMQSEAEKPVKVATKRSVEAVGNMLQNTFPVPESDL